MESIKKILDLELYETSIVSNPIESLEILNSEKFDCVIADVKMPGMNGIELQKEICRKQPTLPVIAISGQSNIGIAVEMIKNGAFDFLEKPVDDEKLISIINNAIEKSELLEANSNINRELEKNYKMIGQSNPFKKLIEQIDMIAPSDARVMITGETGVGKELVAWAIHHNSNRKSKPFLKINCASIPSELLESELFGHTKGAFTGASQNREGKFIAADGGSLFLDEIGDMEQRLQAKLLRILEENEVDVIGENFPRKVDVRVITATNKNLSMEINENRFREDLFHRINLFEIRVPSLRDRADDILPLAKYFLQMFCDIYNKKIFGFSTQLEGILLNQQWNGNVRELKNVIEKLVIVTKNQHIEYADYQKINPQCAYIQQTLRSHNSLKEAKDKFECELIISTLAKHDWKVIDAAEDLGIERTNLFKKMQKYGIKKGSASIC